MKEAVLFKVSLDIYKAYNALDWEMALDLLSVYRVSPRTVRLPWTYGDRLKIIAKAGGYFRRPFKGYRGVTQGYPLSPTIFNMVVDAVIRHWVTVTTPSEVVKRGLGLTIIDLAACFYDDDGFVVLTQTERLQRAFGTLTGLFDRVGLGKNTAKAVGMVCHPCHVLGGISEEGYARRVKGKGPTFWKRQRRRVE